MLAKCLKLVDDHGLLFCKSQAGMSFVQAQSKSEASICCTDTCDWIRCQPLSLKRLDKRVHGRCEWSNIKNLRMTRMVLSGQRGPVEVQ